MTPALPLGLRIRRTSHREVAKAQDLMVQALYEVFPEAVLHGGTAVWRCYQGSRFSEDVDVYLKKDTEGIEHLFILLEQRGFSIEKRKMTDNALYSLLRLGRTEVRLEALFKAARGVLREYETIEGNLITVYTLSAEDIIREKAAAYLSRRKVRDLYDIFFLLRQADSSDVKAALAALVGNYKPPLDAGELRLLILEGAVPDAERMLAYIKERA